MDEHAGVFNRRFEALFVDGILVALVCGVLGYLGGLLLVGGGFGGVAGAYLALQFGAPVALLGYHVAFEGYYGQRPGKHLRSIVVVRDDGSDLGWGSALVRNLLRVVDALPAFYLVGIATAYLTDDHQRLGDVAGNTVVVHAAE